ncbi:MAG: response regulator receiver [Gemmatimonadetes bacterium]|jgi:DNA-binding NarL/FixJ family response regulator|nr:response regulator receiver [Gemmatimonadota bacterium]
MPIRVLTADDHPVVRAGVRAMIANESDIDLVAEATDGTEAIELYDEHLPDVVLMDLRMPRTNGVDATRAIVTAHPRARIIALTSYEGDADIFRALDAGARGYLLKDMLGTEVIRAIRTVAAGNRMIPPEIAARLAEFTPRWELTGREEEVLCLAAKGLRNREIANVIGRTEGTVKVHLKHVLAKLGVEDRTQAVSLAIQRGIVHLD